MDRKKKLIASIILTGALAAIPGAATAEILEFDTPRDEYTTGGGCGGPVILGTTFRNDGLSANEKIMADAWKSHLHARKAAALEGRG